MDVPDGKKDAGSDDCFSVRTGFLFVADGFYRIQTGCFLGRKIAETNTYHCAYGKGDKYRPQWYGGWKTE